jgi:hypothetical protein
MKKTDRIILNNKVKIEKKTKIVDVNVTLWKHNKLCKEIKSGTAQNLQRLLFYTETLCSLVDRYHRFGGTNCYFL